MYISEREQRREDALVQQVLDGDETAFEELVRLFSPVIHRTLSRMFADKGEVEAVVQDTWLQAWRALPRYSPGRPFQPWILRIAVNRSRDIWKKKKELLFSDEGMEEEWLPDDSAAVEDRVILTQELERLAQGVSLLRPEYRTVTALRYDGGLSYKEIADTLRVPVNTVRTYLYRAKQELLKWMEAEDAR